MVRQTTARVHRQPRQSAGRQGPTLGDPPRGHSQATVGSPPKRTQPHKGLPQPQQDTVPGNRPGSLGPKLAEPGCICAQTTSSSPTSKRRPWTEKGPRLQASWAPRAPITVSSGPRASVWSLGAVGKLASSPEPDLRSSLFPRLRLKRDTGKRQWLFAKTKPEEEEMASWADSPCLVSRQALWAP